jgi:hypothetical protein
VYQTPNNLCGQRRSVRFKPKRQGMDEVVSTIQLETGEPSFQNWQQFPRLSILLTKMAGRTKEQHEGTRSQRSSSARAHAIELR